MDRVRDWEQDELRERPEGCENVRDEVGELDDRIADVGEDCVSYGERLDGLVCDGHGGAGSWSWVQLELGLLSSRQGSYSTTTIMAAVCRRDNANYRQTYKSWCSKVVPPW